MVYGINGNFGIIGNIESVTCRYAKAVVASNPTLTARVESVDYSENPFSSGTWPRPTPIALCFDGESGQRAFRKQISDRHTASSPSCAPQTPLSESPLDVLPCSLGGGGDTD